MGTLADYIWRPQGLPWPGGLRGRLCCGRWHDPACKGCRERWWHSFQPGFFATPNPAKQRYNWRYICPSCGLRLGLQDERATTLAKRYERGDDEAKRKLVELASSIAGDASIDDLTRVVEQYDWRRGDFSTWVKAAVV